MKDGYFDMMICPECRRVNPKNPLKNSLADTTCPQCECKLIRIGLEKSEWELKTETEKAGIIQYVGSDKQELDKEELEEIAKVMITSGYNFEGYRIVKYSGYISGDDVIQVERGHESVFKGMATNVGNALTDSLSKIRRQALKELKEAAYDLGCNAVIGVDFDYITLDPEVETFYSNKGTRLLPYVFCVTANGTAVKIEKI